MVGLTALLTVVDTRCVTVVVTHYTRVTVAITGAVLVHAGEVGGTLRENLLAGEVPLQEVVDHPSSVHLLPQPDLNQLRGELESRFGV